MRKRSSGLESGRRQKSRIALRCWRSGEVLNRSTAELQSFGITRKVEITLPAQVFNDLVSAARLSAQAVSSFVREIVIARPGNGNALSPTGIVLLPPDRSGSRKNLLN
jgi:hypothetical protein